MRVEIVREIPVLCRKNGCLYLPQRLLMIANNIVISVATLVFSTIKDMLFLLCDIQIGTYSLDRIMQAGPLSSDATSLSTLILPCREGLMPRGP